jgi:hypothetical protein
MLNSRASRLAACFGGLALASSAVAAPINVISQNFDDTPVNYTSTVLGGTGTTYYNLSNTAGITLNPGISGATGVYLTGQDMDAAAVGGAYSTTSPGRLTFNAVNVSGLNQLKLSISIAGLPTAETENYVRAFIDSDNDAIFETQLFNFQGASNSAYIDQVVPSLGQLSGAFQTFTVNIPQPSSGFLNLQIQQFNDTSSLNEATGIDNIVVTGEAVPEPASLGLIGLGGIALLARRRRQTA